MCVASGTSLGWSTGTVGFGDQAGMAVGAKPFPSKVSKLSLPGSTTTREHPGGRGEAGEDKETPGSRQGSRAVRDDKLWYQAGSESLSGLYGVLAV